TVDFDEDNYEATKFAGDLGPEGFAFIDKEDSPNGEYLLMVGNEVSGTTTIFEVEDQLNPDNTPGSSAPGSSGSSNGALAAGGALAAAVAVIGSVFAALQIVPGGEGQLLNVLPKHMRPQLRKV